MEDKLHELLNNVIYCHVIEKREDVNKISEKSDSLDVRLLGDICDCYGYPITIIQEMQYTDKMYRDAYYTYLSHLHFDISRHCQRLALFRGKFDFLDFFDNDKYNALEKEIIGTIVIRPSYNKGSKYTLGRTLLDPSKTKYRIKYVRTAKFKAIICGHKYIIRAFPYSNQIDDILLCAETSVWELMEYYGNSYETYKTVLPSVILNWKLNELSSRTLPSQGMTYDQISSLLKSFGFEPQVYLRDIYSDSDSLKTKAASQNEVATADSTDTDIVEEISSFSWENIEFVNAQEVAAETHAKEVDFDLLNRYTEDKESLKGKGLREREIASLFHYYVESGIPLVTAICNERESINHSIIIIGHGERSPENLSKKAIEERHFLIGNLVCIDSASFYNRYITIDDNQFPYRCERYDHFSVAQNCKVKAFIVPLYKHILLNAESAVEIIETYIEDFSTEIKNTLELLKEIDGSNVDNSLHNPLVLRYYLTTSRGLVDYRNRNSIYIEEKAYYCSTPFPKFVWVGEISTFQLYKKNEAIGEIVVDATAPAYSGTSAVISIRLGGKYVSRQTGESVHVIKSKFSSKPSGEQDMSYIFKLYTNNLQKGDD